MVLLFVIIICLVAYKATQNANQLQKFDESTYKRVTNNTFLSTYSDKGKYGEYLIYNRLKQYEDIGDKFLFNLYISNSENKTTELDLIMITKKGIIVFESKNYSGWIFGDLNSRMWMQILPKRRGRSYKSQFFNPIFQNKGHINNLKKLVGNDIPFFSIITFSERCTLKKVPESTNEIKVIKRNAVGDAVKNIYEVNPDVIGQEKCDELYNKLYKYSQVNQEIKQAHIKNINNRIK